jgi:hypothetical protein
VIEDVFLGVFCAACASFAVKSFIAKIAKDSQRSQRKAASKTLRRSVSN